MYMHIYIHVGERGCTPAFFLSRLSRRRFISRPTKTNGQIVFKILTAHLGEHVYGAGGGFVERETNGKTKGETIWDSRSIGEVVQHGA